MTNEQLQVVLNYQAARDIESHTHRVGRTGRAGEKGVAYTLITKEEKNFAAMLVENLENANQYVTPELRTLAKQVHGHYCFLTLTRVPILARREKEKERGVEGKALEGLVEANRQLG